MVKKVSFPLQQFCLCPKDAKDIPSTKKMSQSDQKSLIKHPEKRRHLKWQEEPPVAGLLQKKSLTRSVNVIYVYHLQTHLQRFKKRKINVNECKNSWNVWIVYALENRQKKLLNKLTNDFLMPSQFVFNDMLMSGVYYFIILHQLSIPLPSQLVKKTMNNEVFKLKHKWKKRKGGAWIWYQSEMNGIWHGSKKKTFANQLN